MTIHDLLAKYGLSFRDIQILFDIPDRTIRAWRTEYRKPPRYVLLMLDYILRHWEVLTDGEKKTEA